MRGPKGERANTWGGVPHGIQGAAQGSLSYLRSPTILDTMKGYDEASTKITS